MPNLYMIGGANGSGKTTVSRQLLPNVFNCLEYVNADTIAAGISAFNPEAVAIQAGRLMLERLQILSKSGVDFAFETTLAARTFAPFLRSCKNQGYTINLMYFWLPTPELAIERVRQRVASGGHSIPEAVIRRRYERGRHNLISLYIPLCDTWIIYDNSHAVSWLVAEGVRERSPIIYQPEIWQQITNLSYE
ncbi:zeta toxin family protein [[Phormidium] sp. ETS-05]|uniref:zeta toxin family protein n=1 Tax=[Phormidium] sp. ETS-05 TaxID=222819 RepID=UPI0018EF212A|nr:zeta toxin family protein [[Phormidium] sp. ETS-05]